MDGVEFTGTGFCVGDNVTFICNTPSIVHQWRGPDINRALVTSSMPEKTGPDNMFTLVVVNSSASGFVTSLSVKVYSEFNGGNITCSDGNTPPTFIQSATATVLGKIEKCR